MSKQIKIKQLILVPSLMVMLGCSFSCRKTGAIESNASLISEASLISSQTIQQSSLINSTTQKESDFEDGTISPFSICTTQNPAYGQAFTLNGQKCMKFYWTQTGYDGTRMDRGAEACSDLNIYKDGWYGFHFYLSSTAFPTNKSQTIAQVFSNGGCASWTAMLEVKNNALWLVYRGNCATTGNTEVQITGSIQRNAWKDFIIHFRASNNGTGLVQVWYAGAGKNTPTYQATNINFGFGTWVNDTLDANSPIGLKFGMYNWDDGNYTANESRTIYFDNVSQLAGNPSDAWETVNPNL
ncbi:heparin lyase I family protein [Pedobacter frigidisoli]|uniref:heparin lyase I family protein n=1 Tax=Pedobacter frigidisoli TaxID=2530455 RepID=UPI00292D6E35|nr:heparin lyase I family protein [Pedobacter frigidisoli]